MTELSEFGQSKSILLKGECEMKMTMPATISGWCMWLFFLVVGLGLIPAIGAALPAFLAPLFALAYAILSFIGM